MNIFFLQKRNQVAELKVNRGFTLLEVLIAIAILSFAVATTFTATQSGLSSAIESKNQVIGYYLAQEAVEFIRNKRDENSFLQQPWLAGIADNSINDPCYFGKTCLVDVVQGTITTCPTPTTCPYLKQDSNSQAVSYGMYGYGAGGSWVTSSFKREIKLTSINSNEVAILVSITWTKGSFSRTFNVSESLFNWQ